MSENTNAWRTSAACGRSARAVVLILIVALAALPGCGVVLKKL
jgi:hypothetical protein